MSQELLVFNVVTVFLFSLILPLLVRWFRKRPLSKVRAGIVVAADALLCLVVWTAARAALPPSARYDGPPNYLMYGLALGLLAAWPMLTWAGDKKAK